MHAVYMWLFFPAPRYAICSAIWRELLYRREKLFCAVCSVHIHAVIRALCVIMARTEHFSGARRILLWKTCRSFNNPHARHFWNMAHDFPLPRFRSRHSQWRAMSTARDWEDFSRKSWILILSYRFSVSYIHVSTNHDFNFLKILKVVCLGHLLCTKNFCRLQQEKKFTLRGWWHWVCP